MIKLSILDQSPISRGKTASDAIHETVRLAQATEKWGYHRYWLAEHHNYPGLACSAPEILIGHIAANTSTIRVGSGATLLYHYSALKVAENFRMLSALYPGRIDLGLGRAPGGDVQATLALHEGAYPDVSTYLDKIKDLFGYLTDNPGPDHRFKKVHAMPTLVPSPEVWMLGSSDQSAIYAAELGTAYSYAQFLNDHGGKQVMRLYKQRFRPSETLSEPLGSVGIRVLCCDTAEEAEIEAKILDLYMLRIRRGLGDQVPTLEEALSYKYTPLERAYVEHYRQEFLIGDPDFVKKLMLQYQEEYNADEFVIVTITHDYEKRLRSYELVAKAFGMIE